MVPSILAALLLLLALTACGHHNTDPREGRVTLGESNCAVGNCYWDWETCQGPDLLIHIDDHHAQNRTIIDAPECHR